MNCPRCNLVNPPDAVQCDCGYDFRTKTTGSPSRLVKGPVPAGVQERPGVLRKRRKIAALAVLIGFLLAPWLQEWGVFLSLGLLIYCLILTVQIRKMGDFVGRSSSGPAKLSLAKAIGWAVAVFVFDGLFLGQGFISGVVLAYAALVLAPMGILTRKDKALGRYRLQKAGVLAAATVAVLGSIYLNNRFAERAADDLIRAVVLYKDKHGQYPQELQDLVPEFMPAIPPAKLDFSNNYFRYNSGTNPTLWYVDLPPRRRIYYFESKQWGTMD